MWKQPQSKEYAVKFQLIACVVFVIVIAVAIFIYSQQSSSGPAHRSDPADTAFATLKTN